MKVVECFYSTDGLFAPTGKVVDNRHFMALLDSGDPALVAQEYLEACVPLKIAFFKHRVVNNDAHVFPLGETVWATMYGDKTMAFNEDNLWQWVRREQIDPLEDTVEITGRRFKHHFQLGTLVRVANEQRHLLAVDLVRDDGLRQALLAEDFVGVQND